MEVYVPGSIEKLWRELGVKPILQEPCEGEDCFDFSEYVNSLGKQHKSSGTASLRPQS
jgi:hypothetical protein